MPLTLSERCLNISPSVTLTIDSRAKQLRALGLDVIGFGAGEPDFDTPDYIKQAAKDALDLGQTRYTPVAGTAELKEEIQHKLYRDNSLDYQLSEIIVSTGAKQSLFNAISALINPGDEVLLPAPCWVSYPEMIRACGGVPVFVKGRSEDDFIPSANYIEQYVNEKTKAMILNSPCNPTGAVWDLRQLTALAELAVRRGFYVISDEIYEKLVYDGARHISIAALGEDIKKQTIVINGLSKSYAMTGWRVGYAAAPIEIVKAMSAFQSHTTSNCNSIAQHAAAVALTNGEKFMRESYVEFDARRRLMHEALSAIPGLSCRLPKGAFYMMLDISGCIGKHVNGEEITGSEAFARLLLEDKRVAAVPARAFGDDNYLRLSYAVKREKIAEGAKRIGEFVAELK